MLPQVSPSPLTSLKEPIGHPNWIYELKHDGFRGILYVDREQAWLVSRKRLESGGATSLSIPQGAEDYPPEGQGKRPRLKAETTAS